MKSHAITMLGSGFIGDFYTKTLHAQRGRDRVRVVYSRSETRGAAFGERWAIPESTTDMQAAIRHPETDVVIVALPNHLHEEAVQAVAAAGKAVLCTKPLGRNAAEASRMLEAVEKAGVFGVISRTSATRRRRSRQSRPRGPARSGRDLGPLPRGASRTALGVVLDGRLTGGGAIIDLGCHCVEIIRNFVGKGTGRSRSCARPTPWSTRSRTRTTRSRSSGSSPARPARSRSAGRSAAA